MFWATLMKTTLNQTLVTTKLSLDKKPVLKNGKLAFEPNPSMTPYILFDNAQESPVGFGVKVSKKLSYIVQRKVYGKVIKFRVGGVADFLSIDLARIKAAELITTMLETGRNPNQVKKEIHAAEITLGQAFASYRVNDLGWDPQKGAGDILEDQSVDKRRAKPNSIAAFDKAVRKLSDWSNTRIGDLDETTVTKKFKSIFAVYPTSAEQTFRWANVATARAITREATEAQRMKREPTLTYNPFIVLRPLYRKRWELEEAYTRKGIYRPLTETETLGKFLDALWKRRKENRTGGDYLLCSILWGTRKSEAAALEWRDQLTDEQAQITSNVDLDSRIVFFYDTKNRSNFLLPICDAAFEILQQRYEMRNDGQKWVFPARSQNSKTGHYSDSRSLITYVCQDAEIPFVANHNLRRTFATIASDLVSMSMLQFLLNHKNRSQPTNLYIKKEYERVFDALQRIELHLLTTSPTIYNAILAGSKYPPI